MQARHFESVSSEQKLQMTTHRSYVATVNCEEGCVARGRGGDRRHKGQQGDDPSGIFKTRRRGAIDDLLS